MKNTIHKIVINLPEQLFNPAKNKLVDTLTKTKNLKKINKETVIKLNTDPEINIPQILDNGELVEFIPKPVRIKRPKKIPQKEKRKREEEELNEPSPKRKRKDKEIINEIINDIPPKRKEKRKREEGEISPKRKRKDKEIINEILKTEIPQLIIEQEQPQKEIPKIKKPKRLYRKPINEVKEIKEIKKKLKRVNLQLKEPLKPDIIIDDDEEPQSSNIDIIKTNAKLNPLIIDDFINNFDYNTEFKKGKIIKLNKKDSRKKNNKKYYEKTKEKRSIDYFNKKLNNI